MKMSNEQQAIRAFEALKAWLDENEWDYQAEKEKLKITTGGVGEDLQIDIRLIINPERGDVKVLSPMPFNVPEKKRSDIAFSVGLVNDTILAGSFDYDIETGSIWYRHTTSYADMDVAPVVYERLLRDSVKAIDLFNDKFLMIGKGMYTIKQLLEFLEGDF